MTLPPAAKNGCRAGYTRYFRKIFMSQAWFAYGTLVVVPGAHDNEGDSVKIH